MARLTYQIIAVTILLVLGAGVFFVLKQLAKETEKKPPRSVTPPVQVMTVGKEDVTLEVASQGTVNPRTVTVLFPEVSGRIKEISDSFYAGGFFQVEEVLITIDDSDYRTAKLDAEAALRQAELRLAEELAQQKRAIEEWKSLGRRGNPPSLVAREPQVAQAQANVHSAESLVEQAQRNIDRCTIEAPYPGLVRNKMADVGQYVTPNTQLGEIFAIDYAEVMLPVTASELAYLNVPLAFGVGSRGQNAEAAPTKITANIKGTTYEYPANVIRTEGAFDAQSRMMTLVARVQDPYGLNGPPGGMPADDKLTEEVLEELKRKPPLPIGIFTQAAVTGKTLEDVFVLPRQALRGKDQILVVNEEDRVEIRKINIIRSTDDAVFVKEDLEEGERISLTQPDYVVKNMKVNPIDIEDEDSAQDEKPGEVTADEGKLVDATEPNNAPEFAN